jgi:UDP-N-acetylglucosamine 2-epimerase (non-hydrolysing)
MQLNFVLGTAAELIKLSPLIALASQKGVATRIIATGQSRENFLMQARDLSISEREIHWLVTKSDDLREAGSALRWFLRALTVPKNTFSALVLNEGGSGNMIVVHGDTLSTFVGARLAKRARLPVVHVEAGLRSENLFHPFPEEILRRLVSRWVDYHMAPDHKAVVNLQRSKRKGLVISTNGNTLLDAVRAVPPAHHQTKNFALVNVHRFENLNSNERWRIVVETVIKAAAQRHVVFVAHPQTLQKLSVDAKTKAAFLQAGIEIRERMPFTEFLTLLKQSEFLISDGGSNQEECSYLGKPCLLLRLETERQEGLTTCCVLSKFDRGVINNFLQNPGRFASPELAATESPSARIFESLLNA